MQNPKSYAADQCALYKIGSKARLALVLGVSLDRLLFLAHSENNYREFLLHEEICPFTKKITKERLVQEPKLELRKIHERIQKFLNRVIPPDYAHAAIKGRSYSSNAIVHKDAQRIATFDIHKFYPSTTKSHVYNFFAEQLQCAPNVAALLGTLTCFKGTSISNHSGLPTGSPLSPILSLYANKPLFDRLNQLALSNGLKFTCYVDDLTFSGDTIPLELTYLVTKALWQQGHLLSVKKTRIFKGNQASHVTGVVIRNNRIYVPHSRFKKARKIMAAIDAKKQAVGKLPLVQKLAGLLGEAAFLDSRYSSWAKRSYYDLKIAIESAEKEVLN
ncbi:MAG: reverse transcriptase family protein [Sulfuricellaceae bacterium]